MKFSMTQKYMDELNTKHCDGTYKGAYATNSSFSLFPTSFAVFCNDSHIVLVKMTTLTLNVKKVYSIPKEEIIEIKTKKHLTQFSAFIKTKSLGVFKFSIQKKAMGLNQQEDVFLTLQSF